MQKYGSITKLKLIKQPLTRDTMNAPITDKQPIQFQWTGNGHSQLLMTERGKPSPNIDLLRTTGSNGRA